MKTPRLSTMTERFFFWTIVAMLAAIAVSLYVLFTTLPLEGWHNIQL